MTAPSRSRGFTNSEELAGTVAWYYERDGVRPMLIGHSQGGMRVIRTLYELTGEFHAQIAVFDPVAGAPQPRTAIDDPVTGATQPVVGLKVPFAAVLATGQLARVLLGQWDMIPRLRRIPDSAEAFTGFAIPWDPLAGTGPSPEPYVAIGSAAVRNVVLPTTYSHIGLPATEHLPGQPVTRAWIDAYRPDAALPALPSGPDVDVRNLIHAADLWYSIRHHWCREGQRLLRAQGKVSDMRGRLNLFQAAMLRWRELYPYNAVHVAELPGRARRGAPRSGRSPSTSRRWD